MQTNRALASVATVTVAIALVAGCGSSDDPDVATGDTAAPQTTSTTEATPAGHASPDSAAEFCETVAGRDGTEIAALMGDGATAVDHSTGAVYAGPAQIAAWFDEYEGFDTFELTTCADDTVSTNWWAAGTYAFHSETNPGGTEGVAVILTIDDQIHEFHALYTPTGAEPSPAAAVSPEDASALTSWCEAWGTEDADQVIPLASEDLVVHSRSGETRPGDAEQIDKMAFMLAEDAEDTVECGSDVIGNGGWVALAARFVDTDNAEGDRGGSWGGIMMVKIDADGLVGEHAHFMDAMDADDNYVDITQLPTGEIIVNE